MFCDRHSSASTLYTYEDELYILALFDKELVEVLADHALNSKYTYIANLFKCYCSSQLGE